MRRPSIRTALAGAATAAVVLLGVTGLATAGTAGTGISSDEQALAALDQARGDIDAVRGFIASRNPVPAPPITAPPPASTATTAAARYGWGTPIPASSDEFNYDGRPDPAKWSAAGECWPGHAGNGRRCASRSAVTSGMLVQTGLANGDSAWLSSRQNQRYGRWEARVRSYATGSTGNQYHPLLIIWPTSERWPQDGEYDFLENSAPGQACAEAFIHFPHDPGAVQQQFAREANCSAPQSEWHNIALEWTPQHVKGFVDGKEFYSFSGGATGTRRAIQDMPSGSLKIQLDNFYGSGMRAARYEIDWVRVFPLNP